MHIRWRDGCFTYYRGIQFNPSPVRFAFLCIYLETRLRLKARKHGLMPLQSPYGLDLGLGMLHVKGRTRR